jgi:hypothetical protein
VVVVVVVVVLVVVPVVVGPSVVVVVVVVVVAYTEDQLTAAIRSQLAPLVGGGFGHSQYSSVPETDDLSRTY